MRARTESDFLDFNESVPMRPASSCFSSSLMLIDELLEKLDSEEDDEVV